MDRQEWTYPFRGSQRHAMYNFPWGLGEHGGEIINTPPVRRLKRQQFMQWINGQAVHVQNEEVQLGHM